MGLKCVGTMEDFLREAGDTSNCTSEWIEGEMTNTIKQEYINCGKLGHCSQLFIASCDKTLQCPRLGRVYFPTPTILGLAREMWMGEHCLALDQGLTSLFCSHSSHSHEVMMAAASFGKTMKAYGDNLNPTSSLMEKRLR